MSRFRKAVARGLLAFDALVDFAYDAKRRSIRALQAVAAFSDRFHLSGARKFVVEGLCESLNLGVAGLIVVITFALPAYRMTADDDWLKRAGSRSHLPRPLWSRSRAARHQAR